MVIFIFLRSYILFSIMAAPFYSLTNSAQKFLFLHILTLYLLRLAKLHLYSAVCIITFLLPKFCFLVHL